MKIDFSDIPAIIAILIYGPGAGIAVEALKNVLHYLIHGSMSGVPVDQVANFTAGVLFILPVAFIFKKIKSAKGIVWSMFLGTVLMTVMMSILNYFLFLPAYTWFLNAPQLSDNMLKATITAGILPFNLIKGIIITIVFSLIFVKMRPWFENKRRLQNS